jgi:hypothetical protein
MAVQAEKRNPVARLHAGCAQGARQAGSPVGESRIAESLILADHRCLIRKLLLGISEEADRCERNIHGPGIHEFRGWYNCWAK